MQMPNLLSLLVPIAYLSILLGSLATFSYLHRRRKLTQSLSLAPYFPTHTARNTYLTLLHQADTQADLKQVPNSILCAALQERAVEDVLRIHDLQTRKGPLNVLLQRGVVGDEIWQRLLRAEQELEAEIKDLVGEAEALATGWGQHILQSANEIIINRSTKAKIEARRAGLKEEREAWEAQKEKSRLELEGDNGANNTSGHATTNAKVGKTVKAAQTTGTDHEKEKVVASSDEDGVIVETPAGETVADVTGTPSAAGGGGGKNKKKKGKK